jgi:DNA polymerase-3 subunit epsilon
LYTIIDIETTGGKYNEEGITEIAILKYDGEKVVDKFVSLVNPERRIQSYVARLTGIDNEVVLHAPKFYQLAKRIVEITEGTSIVAHNAAFDYRMLRTEFQRLGYEFERPTLCTVALSKRLLPGMDSYSLGKLVKQLGIPLNGRHRAEGDAQATVKLFEMLLNKDTTRNIIAQAKTGQPKKQKDSKLIKLMQDLPSAVGVYYFHDEDGKIIYVGKSGNIKKRINQHFTNDQPKAREMQKAVEKLSYERTGNELIALLKEEQSIKEIQPEFNQALRNKVYSHGLFLDKSLNYHQLYIKKLKDEEQPLMAFKNHQQARKVVSNFVEDYQLCPQLAGVEKKRSGACFNYGIDACKGACIAKESAETYNARLKQLTDRWNFDHKNFLLIDRGRFHHEKSLVHVKDGEVRGFAYFDLNLQITDRSILERIITPIAYQGHARQLVKSYIRKNEKRIKMIEL